MNEIAEVDDNHRRSLPASSSPVSSPSCSSTQTWLTVESPQRLPRTSDRQMEQDQDSLDSHTEMQSSEHPLCRFYEDLFCTSQTLDPLAGALMTSGLQSDVVKQGYLGKLERNQRRYFVLRAGSHTGPSRLEWYKNQEKFTAVGKSAGFEEEDDGYCTLPPAAFFKEVWPVTVKPRGLGRSKSLAGETRLCLTATSLILVRVGVCSDLPSVTIPLLSVRRFGHLEGLFFLELGRSAPNGPGEIWMEARDQGNLAIAQNIHEVVRETVRALRVLPEFSWSPASSHHQPQALLASKRSRPIYRDKLVNVRLNSSPLALPRRNPEIQTSPTRCCLEPCKPDKAEPEPTLSFTSHLSPIRSQLGSRSDAGSYMEMKMEGWELGDEEEGLGYVTMSPQVRHSSPVLPQDDYVTMASPHKLNWPAHSSPSSSFQTSFNSCTSDSYSPIHPSHHQTTEHCLPHWLVTSVQQSETEAGQSQMSFCCSTQSQDDARREQTSAQYRHPAHARPTSSPVGTADVPNLRIPFDMSGLGCTRSVQGSPNSGANQSNGLQAVADKSVRRSQLLSCLPSCLQP
uniref:uncharacterized protein LOC109960514 n=1 Tax=Monopterus albus TaxID=43700 RepID=UPI0009B3E7DF|nr:uncharacterized protein LOC109960514 [Monopterus albus]